MHADIRFSLWRLAESAGFAFCAPVTVRSVFALSAK
jgi:hypothetical protein